MPLRSAALLVRATSLDELGPRLERALRRQKVPPAGVERRIVAVHASGWAALLADSVDGGLARLLSESCEGAVLALELDTAKLALKLRRFTAGEPGPVLAHTAAVPRDVEQLAWDELRAAGVPCALRLCAPESVSLVDESGLPALVVTVRSTGVSLQPARAVTPDAEDAPTPPAQPDSLVQGRGGETCALWVHDLPANVPAAALAAVEEQQALRLCASLAADTDEDHVPRPAFALRTEDPELEARLAAARRERPLLWRLLDPARPPPLSHQGFTSAARRVLPDAQVLRAHRLSLEVAAPAGTVRVRLATAWERALRDPDADPFAPVVAEARALLASAPERLDREAFLRALLPTLVPADDTSLRRGGPAARTGGATPLAEAFAARTGGAAPLAEAFATRAQGSATHPDAGATPPGPGATRPFTRALHAALLCDTGQRITRVDAATLDAHGLSFDEALAHAVGNVDALTLADPRGLLWFDLEQGRVALAAYEDPAGAGRLLSPLFRALLVDVLGGACVAAAPTRDTVLACAAGDEDAAAWLAGEARLRAAEGPFPLDPALLAVDAADVADLPPDAVPA